MLALKCASAAHSYDGITLADNVTVSWITGVEQCQ
jgi:hypothetical protein